MDIKHLQTFLVACETLNFTKTAEKLQYAQSSVTAQIKNLENELNLQLFERLGKKLVLTHSKKEDEYMTELRPLNFSHCCISFLKRIQFN